VKVLKLALAISLTGALLSGCGSKPGTSQKPSDAFHVIVVFDQAGLGDGGFNDAAWAGVNLVAEEMKSKRIPFSASHMVSREEASYLGDLEAAADRADVVVSVGALFADEVAKAALKHPKAKFVHIEGVVNRPNVLVFNFRSEHGGFLAGLVAGQLTKSGRIGVVTGVNIAPVIAYESGFRAGVKLAERIRAAKGRKLKIEVHSATANSFNDPEKGKALAQTLIARGSDVLFRIAGNTGQGVYQAVKETPGVLLIWEDIDRTDAIPGRVPAAALKHVDRAVYEGVLSAFTADFKGGSRVLGVAEGGVELVGPFQNSQNPRDKALADQVAFFKGLVARGKLKVPATKEELAAFDPSDAVQRFLNR